MCKNDRRIIEPVRCRPPQWSSGQSSLATDLEIRVGFPALTDFLRSSKSGTGSTQPHEYR
jgi:hypothetical protein